MYNCFDRIKINLPFSNQVKDDSFFFKSLSPNGNDLISETYSSVGIRIRIDHIKNQILIDFSAKLLGVGYIEKINILNIREVFRKIYKIIQINPREFYTSKPYSCEVVADIHTQDIPTLLESLYHVSKLQTRFRASPNIHTRNNQPTSFYLKKNVITREINEYISIYNKSNELFDGSKKDNISFLSSLSIEEEHILRNYFKDVIRIEGKLGSRRIIKDVFEQKDSYNLYRLLKCDVNGIDKLLKKVYQVEKFDVDVNPNMGFKDLDRINTLITFNNDLERIYETHKLMGNKRQKSKILKPYKEILHKKMKDNENFKINNVKNLLKKVIW